MLNKFNNFEKDNLQLLKKEKLWTFMRVKVYYELLAKSSKTTHSSKNLNTKINYIFSFFYGFTNFFKKYDFYFFSDSGQRKKINGKYVDKLTDPIIKYLNPNRCLQFELPSPQLYKKKNIETKNVISQTTIEIFSYVLAKIYVTIKKNRNTIYEYINKELDLNINYNFYSVFFNIRYSLFKFLFKIMKPKAIFVVCYYDKAYIVKAAKDLNIIVVELQHGIIGKVHPAYYSNILLNNSYIPDYLLSFGLYEKEIVSQKNGIYNLNQIHPIGHYYIEYLYNNFTLNKNLTKQIKNYDLIFSVTLQDSITDKLLDIIEELAEAYQNYLFIIIPREELERYRTQNFKNIILFNELDCYQKTLHSDFHITAYSSCAIEAPSLGVKNILFNINNFSRNYFDGLLSEDNTVIVDSVEEFDRWINLYSSYNSIEVVDSNKYLIQTLYAKNIKVFIEGLEI